MEKMKFRNNYLINTYILVLLLLTSCSHKVSKQNDSFVNVVLSDIDSRNSYYISIRIFWQGKTSYSIIQNSELYYYFWEKDKLNVVEYNDKMKRILEANSILHIQDTTLADWGFVNVKQQEMDRIADNTKDEILLTYFNGNVLKKYINIDKRNAIIQKLFDLGVPSKIDSETGYLILP